jgi:hypothetical protein
MKILRSQPNAVPAVAAAAVVSFMGHRTALAPVAEPATITPPVGELLHDDHRRNERARRRSCRRRVSGGALSDGRDGVVCAAVGINMARSLRAARVAVAAATPWSDVDHRSEASVHD